MKRLLTISILFISILALQPASAFAKAEKEVYKGKIAGKSVLVELYVDWDTNKVHGTYYYYNNKGEKLSSKLTLKGEHAVAARSLYYLLTETYNGKYCGEWNIYTSPDETSNGLEGTFTNPKGKEYSIKLRKAN